jgi:hypothetical protein
MKGTRSPRFRTKLSMISDEGKRKSRSRSGHRERQTIGALKQLEAGGKAEDLALEVACRSTRSTPGTRSTARWI